jgi:apolipoprotein D and lipocalin family protein
MKPTVFAVAMAATAALLASAPASAQSPGGNPPALAPLPQLDVPAYLGTWYQVAWFPNRFQRQCVSDTRATYRERADGRIDVINECREANGNTDRVEGVARAPGVREGALLKPAQLEVSFLPAWLRWLPAWGDYWVIDLAPDGRYAVVSEPRREYLWVLARAPRLAAEDEAAIRSRLLALGFSDLSRWQTHPHTAGPATPSAAPAP